MEHRPKVFAVTAFAAGILVCLGFKDLYPHLQRRYERRFGGKHAANKTMAGAGLGENDHIGLVDHETNDGVTQGMSIVPEGIEACIGNTPLFRIKSLSDETGCEILAKAEVAMPKLQINLGFSDTRQVSKWSRW